MEPTPLNQQMEPMALMELTPLSQQMVLMVQMEPMAQTPLNQQMALMEPTELTLLNPQMEPKEAEITLTPLIKPPSHAIVQAELTAIVLL